MRAPPQATTLKRTCALDDTFDESLEEDRGVKGKGKKKATAKGKKRSSANVGVDKENAENNAARKVKVPVRKRARRSLGLQELGETDKTAAHTTETPPAFTFKQGKTSLRERKIQKQKRLSEDTSQSRIEELVAYFSGLDEQRLSFA
ncbi:hypothetical protein Poli38472_000632 [Pythium oligandrum]|uniref:Uncharacterized protein n=1 Tax=Pythium oligandrum TaxID=41045 RepID=A0A8K1CD34_PYTOL|nr:hypothetical protein Poli38472_000632 [Pythium oligandrum]|eukprot:TMW60590.1 hypothetical protein Poli38472_000632 [Pythium oligandrum]